jgi:hypothetical protein
VLRSSVTSRTDDQTGVTVPAEPALSQPVPRLTAAHYRTELPRQRETASAGISNQLAFGAYELGPVVSSFDQQRPRIPAQRRVIRCGVQLLQSGELTVQRCTHRLAVTRTSSGTSPTLSAASVSGALALAPTARGNRFCLGHSDRLCMISASVTEPVMGPCRIRDAGNPAQTSWTRSGCRLRQG